MFEPGPMDYETGHKRKDGGVKWVENTGKTSLEETLHRAKQIPGPGKARSHWNLWVDRVTLVCLFCCSVLCQGPMKPSRCGGRHHLSLVLCHQTSKCSIAYMIVVENEQHIPTTQPVTINTRRVNNQSSPGLLTITTPSPSPSLA